MGKKRRGRKHPSETAERARALPAPAGAATAPVARDEPPAGFELLIETKPAGLVRRFFTTQRHFLGLLGGGLLAYSRTARDDGKRGLGVLLTRFWAAMARPFVSRALRDQPFPVQLRR